MTNTVGAGHVFQGRFWNKGIENCDHFMTVLRYVEANPLQAGLVRNAEDWRWNSLVLRHTVPEVFDPLPIDLPGNWLRIVSQPVSQAEINRIVSTWKRRVERGRLQERSVRGEGSAT